MWAIGAITDGKCPSWGRAPRRTTDRRVLPLLRPTCLWSPGHQRTCLPSGHASGVALTGPISPALNSEVLAQPTSPQSEPGTRPAAAPGGPLSLWGTSLGFGRRPALPPPPCLACWACLPGRPRGCSIRIRETRAHWDRAGSQWTGCARGLRSLPGEAPPGATLSPCHRSGWLPRSSARRP